jgi:hypothetical protein
LKRLPCRSSGDCWKAQTIRRFAQIQALMASQLVQPLRQRISMT